MHYSTQKVKMQQNLGCSSCIAVAIQQADLNLLQSLLALPLVYHDAFWSPIPRFVLKTPTGDHVGLIEPGSNTEDTSDPVVSAPNQNKHQNNHTKTSVSHSFERLPCGHFCADPELNSPIEPITGDINDWIGQPHSQWYVVSLIALAIRFQDPRRTFNPLQVLLKSGRLDSSPSEWVVMHDLVLAVGKSPVLVPVNGLKTYPRGKVFEIRALSQAPPITLRKTKALGTADTAITRKLAVPSSSERMLLFLVRVLHPVALLRPHFPAFEELLRILLEYGTVPNKNQWILDQYYSSPITTNNLSDSGSLTSCPDTLEGLAYNSIVTFLSAIHVCSQRVLDLIIAHGVDVNVELYTIPSSVPRRAPIGYNDLYIKIRSDS